MSRPGSQAQPRILTPLERAHLAMEAKETDYPVLAQAARDVAAEARDFKFDFMAEPLRLMADRLATKPEHLPDAVAVLNVAAQRADGLKDWNYRGATVVQEKIRARWVRYARQLPVSEQVGAVRAVFDNGNHSLVLQAVRLATRVAPQLPVETRVEWLDATYSQARNLSKARQWQVASLWAGAVQAQPSADKIIQAAQEVRGSNHEPQVLAAAHLILKNVDRVPSLWKQHDAVKYALFHQLTVSKRGDIQPALDIQADTVARAPRRVAGLYNVIPSIATLRQGLEVKLKEVDAVVGTTSPTRSAAAAFVQRFGAKGPQPKMT